MSTVEIYVLCKERSKLLGEKFLNHFIPNRNPVAEDYPFPELVDNPEITYTKVSDLMTRLDTDKTEGYAIYWDNNENISPFQGMLFYTEDGCMIAGVVVKEGTQKEWIQKIADYVDAQFGYTIIEEAPPETKDEFLNNCKYYIGIKLLKGKIVE